MRKSRKILIAAGGTGGHLIPAQQLGELLRKNGDCEVVFAGYKLEKSAYFARNQFRFFEVSSAPKKSGRWGLAKALAKGFFQALRILLKERPDGVVGFGSYHSAPVLFASALLRKKIVLYEANRTLGKVNRWLLPFANAIGYQFPLIDPTSRKLTPVRWFPWIEKKRRAQSKQEALAEYGLEEGRLTVLVFGGSQGALFLNETAPAVLKRLGAQAIHFAGSEEGAELARNLYKKEKIPAAVKVFESDMAKAYGAADVALCRSGAGTVAELIRFCLPALLIPYPYAAEEHQQQNAKYLSDLGGAVFLAQKEASVEAMATRIKEANLDEMGRALKRAAEENRATIEFYQLVSGICSGKYTVRREVL